VLPEVTVRSICGKQRNYHMHQVERFCITDRTWFNGSDHLLGSVIPNVL
jgi:hypothetical protein